MLLADLCCTFEAAQAKGEGVAMRPDRGPDERMQGGALMNILLFSMPDSFEHMATIEKHGKAITARTAVAGQVGSVFQAAGIALPPNLHERAA